MSENGETGLETRLLRLEHELQELISDQIPSINRKLDLVENKTNKILSFLNFFEEKLLQMDRDVMKLRLQDKK